MASPNQAKSIGIIGMGDMGKIAWEKDWRINNRISDYIIYSVEAEAIEKIVALTDVFEATKVGAIVGGQTSCKAPELAAFDKHLPEDVEIISIHSLHGPSVNPKGQPFGVNEANSQCQVIIQHRAADESVRFVEELFSTFESRYVHLSGEMHDRITADTQAVTHAAFLSMGQAWQANNQFPWELPRYVGGIENVKINITLRIYSNKWHVYAGLAILNPAAQKQVRQYAQSVTELFKLMLGGHVDDFKARVRTAGKAVFKTGTRRELLLEDEVLDRFSLGNAPPSKMPNSHLSLLAIVDCWWKLGINPYDHMICSTPLFRLWLGVTEYVFRNEDLLEDIMDIAMNDDTFRSDDLEFTFAARAWSDCVSFGDFDSYRDRFENIQNYFAPRFPEAVRLGNEMVKTILAKTEASKDASKHREILNPCGLWYLVIIELDVTESLMHACSNEACSSAFPRNKGWQNDTMATLASIVTSSMHIQWISTSASTDNNACTRGIGSMAVSFGYETGSPHNDYYFVHIPTGLPTECGAPVYSHLRAPRNDYEWVTFGHGKQIKGTQTIFMYPASEGRFVFLLARVDGKSFREGSPLNENAPSVRLRPVQASSTVALDLFRAAGPDRSVTQQRHIGLLLSIVTGLYIRRLRQPHREAGV
ncbi:prephenate dehydrogenase (NADP(+)) [Ascosphaera aggregata]|nr:prephenate dehydrogenase (NADP(+)) [Ascosphaera aggregata]